MRTVSFLALAMIALTSIQLRAESPQEPVSVDEGQGRLEKLLGRFLPENNRSFRVTMKVEKEHTPEQDAKVVIASETTHIFNPPVRKGDHLFFDTLYIADTKVFDLGADGKRTLSRTIQKNGAVRYTLWRENTGLWQFVTNVSVFDNPHFLDRPSEFGTVIWGENEVRFVGVSVDTFFTHKGGLRLSAARNDLSLRSDGNDLLMKSTSQSYELAKDPTGVALPFPDWSAPVGVPFIEEYRLKR